MKTLEDAKEIMRLCNWGYSSFIDKEVDKWAEDLWHGYACELCGNCCPECSTPETLQWVWPELRDYEEKATLEEWKISKYSPKSCEEGDAE